MRTLLALLLLTGTASAHVTLMSPPPRTLDNKAGPCGATGSTRGTTVTTYAPGQTIMVEFDENVDHPGHYRIAFDDDGDDVFQNPSTPDDNFAFTLKEPIADKAGGIYTEAVTLPNKTCERCTLQLIQVMTTVVPYNSFYYQCADIRLATDGGAGATGGGVTGGCAASAGGDAGGLAVVLGGLAVVLRRSRARASR